MKKFLVINNIAIQSMNAVAGITYGGISPVAALGYTHNLERKISQHHTYNGIRLIGCMIACHKVDLHTFYNDKNSLKFTQSRNPRYLHGLSDDKKSSPASVIEEGKMNTTLSLVIQYEGELPYDEATFLSWLTQQCYLQRFAGGTIIHIDSLHLYQFSHNASNNQKRLKQLVQLLMPSFVLYSRFKDLASGENAQSSTLEQFIEAIELKHTARPKHHLIDTHLKKSNPELYVIWLDYLAKPYKTTPIPQAINTYLDEIPNQKNKAIKEILTQWQAYKNPTAKTDADWSVAPKPIGGYVVPIMCGYKAISPLYPNGTIQATRDSTTDVCFVEAVHTLGEWRGLHRIKTLDDLSCSIWRYHYEDHWYLAHQNTLSSDDTNLDTINLIDDYEF